MTKRSWFAYLPHFRDRGTSGSFDTFVAITQRCGIDENEQAVERAHR